MSEEIPFLLYYPALPAGLVVERSYGRVDLGIDGGPLAGAYLRNAAGTEWYGADWTGAMEDPEPWLTAAFWGPRPTLAAVKPLMMGQVVHLIDTEGTDGSSNWLPTLP